MLILTKSRIGLAVVMAIGIASHAKGSIPENITDDTALYQEMSEIRVKRRKNEIRFDSDVKKLARAEKRFNGEKTPSLKDHPRLSRVLKRITSKEYAQKYYQNNRKRRNR